MKVVKMKFTPCCRLGVIEILEIEGVKAGSFF